MKYIIYGFAIVIVIYLGRDYIKGWILSFRSKKNEIEYIPIRNEVFPPKGITRHFDFTLELEELGDGQVSATLVKRKVKEV